MAKCFPGPIHRDINPPEAKGKTYGVGRTNPVGHKGPSKQKTLAEAGKLNGCP